MNTEAIRYFVMLAQAGSFNAAAKALFISPQGVNKSITALEHELGTTLVTRSRSGVRLTEQGQALLPHARTIMTTIGNAIDDIALVDAKTDEGTTPLKISASSYAMTILAGLLANGSGILANTEPSEETADSVKRFAAQGRNDELYLLELRHVDTEALSEETPFAFEPLLSTYSGIIWREGFPLAGHHSISRSSLSDIPIAYNSQGDLMAYIKDIFADTPLNNVQLRTSVIRLLIEFAHGKAASLFDSFGYNVSMADPTLPTEGLHFTPLSTPLARFDVGFIYRKDAHPNARCRRFIEYTKRTFEANYSEAVLG